MSTLATAWSLLVVVLTMVAYASRLRLARRPAGPRPPITVLRPCEGEDESLEEALASSFRLAGTVQVVVCTPDPENAASALARRVMAAYPHVASVLVHDAAPHWKNPKARRLSGAWPHLRHEVVVQADADVVLDEDTVTQLLAALEPDVAAVWCVPIPDGPGFGARLLRAVMAGSFDALSVTAGLSAQVGSAPALSGALLAYRHPHLPEGYACAADDIGDDLAIGLALAKHGRIVAAGVPVVCDRRPLPVPAVRAMLRRWIRVALGPAFPRVFGFPTMLASLPTLLVAAPFAPAAALFAASVRVVGALALRRELTRDPLSPALLLETLLAEFLVLDAATRAAWDHLRGRDLVWRNRRYRLGPGGRILAVEG